MSTRLANDLAALDARGATPWRRFDATRGEVDTTATPSQRQTRRAATVASARDDDDDDDDDAAPAHTLDSIDTHMYEIPDYAKSGADPNLRRVQLDPMFEQFRAADVDAVDELRPPHLPQLPRSEVEEIMARDNELQRRQEIIQSDRRLQFIQLVADHTDIELTASNAELASYVGGSRPSTTLVSAGVAQELSPVRVGPGTTPEQRVGTTTPVQMFGGGNNNNTVMPARGAGAVSMMSPLDMIFNANPQVQELGRNVLRSEQMRRAATAYILRPEATGLVLINSKINSHALMVFDELRLTRPRRFGGNCTMIDFVFSDDLWKLFAALTAAKLNMTYGGYAPKRDVLQLRFTRNADYYETALGVMSRDARFDANAYDRSQRIYSFRLRQALGGASTASVTPYDYSANAGVSTGPLSVAPGVTQHWLYEAPSRAPACASTDPNALGLTAADVLW